MRQRVDADQADSDTAYFYALLYYGEFIAKLVVALLVACIRDDRDRHRYRITWELVRANSLGDWGKALEWILTGPAAQFLDPAIQDSRKALTQKHDRSAWQHHAVEDLHEVLPLFGVKTDGVPRKVACRSWWPLFVQIRNRTRGHGAPRGQACREAATRLRRSIDHVSDNLPLLSHPSAYLHRNLSGKYRVTRLSGDSQVFDHLRSETTYNYPDGVYVALSTLRRVELLLTDEEARDFYLPNGNFNGKRFEWLSPISDEIRQGDARPYLTPAGELPPSETEGLGTLDIVGRVFSNMPSAPPNYIHRPVLEDKLATVLNHERHEIVSLSGPGGIGKTYLALNVLYRLAETRRFDLVLWFSARDIDLVAQGPKPVRPSVVTIDDCASEYVDLLAPGEAAESGFSATDHFASALRSSGIGPTLFVFDNFETVVNPREVYKWLDTYIRPPHKILITTRIRDFVGDYPVHIKGMQLEESQELISQAASQLRVSAMITNTISENIHSESDGHPYVMKILVGEMARTGNAGNIERIAGGQEEILTALFERTFAALEPAAQRVFLTVSSWRSLLPEVAVEAVLLRPQNERIDVRNAIDRLKHCSFVEEEIDETTGEVLLSVPLVASIFGRRKLAVSPWRAAVLADAEFLRELGPIQKTDLRHGITPRFRRFFRSLGMKIVSEEVEKDGVVPIIEFMARRLPSSWIELADVMRGIGNPVEHLSERECLRKYLEDASDEAAVPAVWQRLARLCEHDEDHIGEIQALVEMTKSGACATEAISEAANRVNAILRDDHLAVGDTDQKHVLVHEIASEFAKRIDELDATDCSRLAWLFLHLNERDRAREIVRCGLEKSPDNTYCLGLRDTLQ